MADFVPRDPSAPNAGTINGLAINTAGVIRGMKQEPSAEGRKVVVDVAANGAFRLNVFFTPDGSSWYIASQTGSTPGVNVDGGQAGFTHSARIDITWGYVYKIEIYSTAGTISYAYNIREYTVT